MAADKETLVSPLTAAMGKENDGTLRTLLDHGMDEVGSTQAKESAVCDDRAKNLDALLGHFEGDDETRRYLMNDGMPPLHLAVSLGRLACSGCPDRGGSR